MNVSTGWSVPRLLYSKKDAAMMLSVSLRTVDNLIITKNLKPIRVGSRVLIPAEELRLFCKRGSPELN
jgi:excisionase family DNA binding protein